MITTNPRRRLSAADLLPYQKRIPRGHVLGVPWIVLAELAAIIVIGCAVGAAL